MDKDDEAPKKRHKVGSTSGSKIGDAWQPQLSGPGCNLLNVHVKFAPFEVTFPRLPRCVSGAWQPVAKDVEICISRRKELLLKLSSGRFPFLRVRWPQHGIFWAIFKILSYEVHSRGFSRTWDTGFGVEVAEGVEALYIFFDPMPLKLSDTPEVFARHPSVLAITENSAKALQHRTPMCLS